MYTLKTNPLRKCLLSFIILAITLMPLQIIAQPEASKDSPLTQEQFIKGCTAYRSNVIQGIIDVMVDFNQLVDSLQNKSKTPQGHEVFRKEFMDGILNRRFYSVRDLISDSYPFLEINDSKSYRAYRDWGNKNRFYLHEINILIQDSIVKPVQPFKLGNLNNWWQEISFYDIRAHQSILDMGAGNGFLSFILAMTEVPLTVIMTEIDEDFYNYLMEKMKPLQETGKFRNVSVRKGEQKSLGLDTIKFDRIIMRDVYHHLEYPQEILSSVKDHLSENGYLLVTEGTTDIKGGPYKLCKEATTHDLIVKTITQQGFELVDKKIVNYAYLMKFRLLKS